MTYIPPRLKSRTAPPGYPDEAAGPWTLLLTSSGRGAIRFFDNREAHAAAVAVFFRDRAPGIFGFLAGGERTLHLGGAFHQLVEIHRTELAANHPEITSALHDSLLLLPLAELV